MVTKTLSFIVQTFQAYNDILKGHKAHIGTIGLNEIEENEVSKEKKREDR